MIRKFTCIYQSKFTTHSFNPFVVLLVLLFSVSLNAQQQARTAFDAQSVEVTQSPIEVLLFNYCVYDAFYARSIRTILEQNREDLDIAEFWSGDAKTFEAALKDKDAVIVPYAAQSKKKILNDYTRPLRAFVEAGGTVLFTGTHEYHALQVFDLLDIDGVEYKDSPVFKTITNDRLTVAVPDTFYSKNFAYPITVYSPDFVTVAEVSGSKSIGYVKKGKGKVIYAGIEFYYDEPATTRILMNALEEAFERQSDIEYERKLAEERARLQLEPPVEAVSSLDWNVYPNPYTSTAFAELNLTETTAVSLEVMSETGALVSTMLNKQQLATGSYTYTLPELPNGIYFLRYTCGSELIVKKVVKMYVP